MSGSSSLRNHGPRMLQEHYVRRQRHQGMPIMAYREYSELEGNSQAAPDKGTKAVEEWHNNDSPRLCGKLLRSGLPFGKS